VQTEAPTSKTGSEYTASTEQTPGFVWQWLFDRGIS